MERIKFFIRQWLGVLDPKDAVGLIAEMGHVQTKLRKVEEKLADLDDRIGMLKDDPRDLEYDASAFPDDWRSDISEAMKSLAEAITDRFD